MKVRLPPTYWATFSLKNSSCLFFKIDIPSTIAESSFFTWTSLGNLYQYSSYCLCSFAIQFSTLLETRIVENAYLPCFGYSFRVPLGKLSQLKKILQLGKGVFSRKPLNGSSTAFWWSCYIIDIGKGSEWHQQRGIEIWD